jgi:hypothetical protein
MKGSSMIFVFYILNTVSAIVNEIKPDNLDFELEKAARKAATHYLDLADSDEGFYCGLHEHLTKHVKYIALRDFEERNKAN